MEQEYALIYCSQRNCFHFPDTTTPMRVTFTAATDLEATQKAYEILQKLNKEPKKGYHIFIKLLHIIQPEIAEEI